MGIDERIIWLLIGCAIGFFAGYFTKYLRDIKEELDDVKNIVSTIESKKDERGVMRLKVVPDLALLLVIFLVVWAAFSSQQASNTVQDTQVRLDRITKCNQVYLSKTIAALNERTSNAQNQAAANVELQRAQATMISILISKPRSDEAGRDEAVQKYFISLTKYVQAAGNYKDSANANPYPSDEDFTACVDAPIKED